MSLSLPEDLEPHATSYDQLTSPGIYCLLLERPSDPIGEWDDTFDVRPPWLEDYATARRVSYVGASKNVLGRLEDHRDGDVRKASLLRVCDVEGIHTVWWCESAEEAFEKESGVALLLANERDDWFVHQN